MKRLNRPLLGVVAVSVCMSAGLALAQAGSEGSDRSVLADIKRQLEAEIAAGQRVGIAEVKPAAPVPDPELGKIREQLQAELQASQNRLAVRSSELEQTRTSLEEKWATFRTSNDRALAAQRDEAARQAAILGEVRGQIGSLQKELKEGLAATEASLAHDRQGLLSGIEGQLNKLGEELRAEQEKSFKQGAGAPNLDGVKQTLLEALNAFGADLRAKREADLKERSRQVAEERKTMMDAIAGFRDEWEKARAREKAERSNELESMKQELRGALVQETRVAAAEASKQVATAASEQGRERWRVLESEMREAVLKNLGQTIDDAVVKSRGSIDQYRDELTAQLRQDREQHMEQQARLAAATGRALGEFKVKLAEDLRTMEKAAVKERIDEMTADLVAFQADVKTSIRSEAAEHAELLDTALNAERSALQEQRRTLEEELRTQRENDAKARAAQTEALRRDLARYRKELTDSFQAQYEAEAAARASELQSARDSLVSVRKQLEKELGDVRSVRGALRDREAELAVHKESLESERESMDHFKSRLKTEMESWLDVETKSRAQAADEARRSLEAFQERRNTLLEMAPPAPAAPAGEIKQVNVPRPNSLPAPGKKPKSLLPIVGGKKPVPEAEVIWPE